MSIKCQNCGTENVDNAKYCCECGNEIGFYCRKCGTFNRSGKFCISCGTKNDPIDWNNASTNPNDYSWENVYEDESGTYTADRLVFLKGNYDAKRIEIRQGTRIICDDALGEYYWIDEYDDYDFKDSIVEEIIIPDSVTQIGRRAFFGCESLPRGNNGLLIINDWLIEAPLNIEQITIPNIVRKIGDSAFRGCESLQSIVIPDSVTQIGDEAFDGCSSLQSIVLPDSVTQIGRRAFDGCSSLQSIVLPDSVTQIGSLAFYGCSSLQSIIIPDSVTQIGKEAFTDCNSLRSIVIPKSSKERFLRLIPEYEHLLQEQ